MRHLELMKKQYTLAILLNEFGIILQFRAEYTNQAHIPQRFTTYRDM